MLTDKICIIQEDINIRFKGSETSVSNTNTIIMGKKVMSRVPAKLQTPVSLGLRDTRSADEVLLEDSSVVYQCGWKGCYKAYTNVYATNGHYASHIKSKKQKARKAAEKRKALLAAKKTVTEETATKVSKVNGIPQSKSNLLGMATRLEALAAQLREQAEEITWIPDEIVEKANRYENLRSILGE